jgi:hypothetical protein
MNYGFAYTARGRWAGRWNRLAQAIGAEVELLDRAAWAEFHVRFPHSRKSRA